MKKLLTVLLVAAGFAAGRSWEMWTKPAPARASVMASSVIYAISGADVTSSSDQYAAITGLNIQFQPTQTVAIYKFTLGTATISAGTVTAFTPDTTAPQPSWTITIPSGATSAPWSFSGAGVLPNQSNAFTGAALTTTESNLAAVASSYIGPAESGACGLGFFGANCTYYNYATGVTP